MCLMGGGVVEMTAPAEDEVTSGVSISSLAEREGGKEGGRKEEREGKREGGMEEGMKREEGREGGREWR